MYLYSASISASLGNQVHSTAVSLRHPSRDINLVEAYVLAEIAVEVFSVGQGYHSHSVQVDSFPDDWIVEAYEYLRRN